MAYLIDTHALIWAAGEPERLSEHVRQLFASDATLCLSHVSAWEMMLKGAKLRLPCGVSEFVQTRSKTLQLASLPLSWHHLREFEHLPRLHTDPFDRMLVAQARADKMTLVSADHKLARYDVPLVW